MSRPLVGILSLIVQLSVALFLFLLSQVPIRALESFSVDSTAEAAAKSSRANALVQAGRPEEAIPIYRELISIFKDEPSLTINLIVALFKAGHYGEVMDECSAILKSKPELFPAWLFLGASELEAGAPGKAEETLRKALAVNPEDPNARVLLADALLQLKRTNEAARQFEALAKTMPDSPQILFGLGQSYEGLAQEAVARLQERSPASAEALSLNARLELECGQAAEAFQHFRQALALKPDLRTVRQHIAAIYEATGHPEWAAIESAKQPADTPCKDNSLECEFTAGHFEQVVSRSAETSEDIFWQANAYISLSQRALNRLQELPPSKERYQALAIEEEKRGRRPEAAEAWKKAVQLQPDRQAVAASTGARPLSKQ